MKKLLLILLLKFFLFASCLAQQSCGLRISLLTCTPGNELYSTFGHTALRVQDAATGNDLIFNYGTFEFSGDFYFKFVKGRLLYYLSVQDFESFVYQYQVESRSIIEQELNLDCNQKQQLFTALQVNAKEENRYYRYDFLLDNCTTRAKDMVKKQSGAGISFFNIFPQGRPTFRQLIHSYLDKARQHWSKLGIDLLLGARLDRKVTNEQAMFLPDYLMKGFDNATTDGRPLVKSKQVILQMPVIANNTIFTPLAVFSVLLVLVIALSFSTPKMRNIIRLCDVIFFFTLGLIGLLLLFMWFGTEHNVMHNNYNLLWAVPTHFFAAIFLIKKKTWVPQYFTLVFWVSIALLLFWFFLPQQMNNGFLPVLLLIIFRSGMISRITYATKRN